MFNLSKVKNYIFMELVNMVLDFGPDSSILHKKVFCINNHNGWDWPD